MGFWVKNIGDAQVRVKDDSGFDKVFDFCCSREICEKCIYANSLDCISDCHLQCNTTVDILEKFGYKYVENDEPESEPNPDWPPICNYIGVPPETDFMFDGKVYKITLNGYVEIKGFIESGIILYGILNHPDKIIVLQPLTKEDTDLIKALHDFLKVADHQIIKNETNEIYLKNDITKDKLALSSGYFSNLKPGTYNLNDLYAQITLES